MSLLDANLELIDYEVSIANVIFDNAVNTIYKCFHKPRWLMFIYRDVLHRYSSFEAFHITYFPEDRQVKPFAYQMVFNDEMSRRDIRARLSKEWMTTIERWNLPHEPPNRISVIKC